MLIAWKVKKWYQRNPTRQTRVVKIKKQIDNSNEIVPSAPFKEDLCPSSEYNIDSKKDSTDSSNILENEQNMLVSSTTVIDKLRDFTNHNNEKLNKQEHLTVNSNIFNINSNQTIQKNDNLKLQSFITIFCIILIISLIFIFNIYVYIKASIQFSLKEKVINLN